MISPLRGTRRKKPMESKRLHLSAFPFSLNPSTTHRFCSSGVSTAGCQVLFQALVQALFQALGYGSNGHGAGWLSRSCEWTLEKGVSILNRNDTNSYKEETVVA